MISKIKFVLVESFRGFFYARTPVLLSSMTIGISLIVISISFYGYLLFMKYSGSFNNEYKIEVFFKKELKLKLVLDKMPTQVIKSNLELLSFM